MYCYKHQNEEAVAQCSECSRALCAECARKISPPLCVDCAKNYSREVKSEMIKNIAISMVFMIIGIVLIKNPLGLLLAGIPYGWSILNSMTPDMFLWLSWIGWIVYFIIKLVLSYIIGLVALPIKLIKWILTLKRVNALLKAVE